MAKAKVTKSAKKPTKAPAAKTTTAKVVQSASVQKVSSRRFTLRHDQLQLGALFAELIGSFVLTAAVLNTGGNAIIAAITVLILTLMLSSLSGAHVNPLVTLSLWATRQMNWMRALGYLFAQSLGAMLALVVVSNFVSTADTNGLAGKVFEVGALVGDWRPFIAETLGAMVFGFGVASVFMDKKEGFEAAFTVGGSLLLGLVIATLGSSAVLNPAAAIGLSAYDFANLWTVLVYLVGPVLGAVAGAWLYKLLKWDVQNTK